MTEDRGGDLGRKVEAAESLLSVAGTMKALSASRIRRFRQAAGDLRDYDRTIELALHVALGLVPDDGIRGASESVSPEAAEGPVGMVVFGSDLGLAGPYNARIAEFSLERWEALASGSGESLLLVVGARATALLEALGLRVDETLAVPDSVAAIGAAAREIVVHLGAWRTDRGCDRIHLVYHALRRGVEYEPVSLRLAPLDESWLDEVRSRPWPTRVLPMTLSPWGALLSHLVREHMFVRVVGALADSIAAEHASRMAAMEVAERRIEERLTDLRGRAHRERQASITEELQELSAGYEAIVRREP